MSTITPTVGRKVWFYSTSSIFTKLDKKTPMDATVTYVHEDGTVNLSVTDHTGISNTRRNVSLSDPQDHDSHENGEYATWMPYQVGQAKAAS